METIKLQITKQVLKTEEELRIEENSRTNLLQYHYDNSRAKYKDIILDVEITQEQFEKIRKAVLEVF